MGAGLEVAAREPARDLQEERVLLPVLQRVAAHGGLCECFLPGSAGERVVGAAAIPEARRHVPRESVYLARGVAERPGRDPDGAAQRHRLRRSRHRDAVALVPPCELVADLVPAQRQRSRSMSGASERNSCMKRSNMRRLEKGSGRVSPRQ